MLSALQTVNAAALASRRPSLVISLDLDQLHGQGRWKLSSTVALLDDRAKKEPRADRVVLLTALCPELNGDKYLNNDLEGSVKGAVSSTTNASWLNHHMWSDEKKGQPSHWPSLSCRHCIHT